jgi:A/G-specific adenine glycosylase
MKSFQNKVLTWYSKNKRDLPWRKTTDPYKILVSEVMLQQTQVDRVIPFFNQWLKEWPDVKSLAKADTHRLLELWSGLGYNNRALRLRKLCQFLVEKNNGEMPRQKDVLLSLPGIGPYTAGAVMAFAYNKEVAVVDTNIRRVFIHELKLDEDISNDELEKIALEVVPKGKSCIWYNALMDYGALFKTARKTGIESLSKQGKFEGSDRQLRGDIVKRLLQEKSLKRDSIVDDRAERVIKGMVRDGVIVVEKNIVSLP